jgi:hypothetical protein
LHNKGAAFRSTPTKRPLKLAGAFGTEPGMEERLEYLAAEREKKGS